jgi:hypothetical protein
MSGEIDLKKLIAAMTPVLAETEYVFGTLETNSYEKLAQLEPIGTFQEKEGLTVIVKKEKAEEFNIIHSGRFKWLCSILMLVLICGYQYLLFI